MTKQERGGGGVSVLYTVQPSTGSDCWYVWDMYSDPSSPDIVFTGSMEDCYFVADSMNLRLETEQFQEREAESTPEAPRSG